MDLSWSELWELFPFAILSALVAGLVCPLVGAFLLVRRTGFYGVALPQFAAAGVAFGYALLPFWLEHVGLAGMDMATALASPHATKNYLVAWAFLFTLAALLLLVACGRNEATETGRVAASFAVASALTVLFAKASPTGKASLDTLLSGEILVVDLHDFETLAVAFGLVFAGLVWLHRDLALVSYDRDTAFVLGKRVRLLEGMLLLFTGLTVSIGVLVVGPIVLFGLLVIPPLAARRLARSMQSYYVLSCAFGVGTTLLGLVVSFRFDLPLGAAIVATATTTLLPALVVRRV